MVDKQGLLEFQIRMSYRSPETSESPCSLKRAMCKVTGGSLFGRFNKCQIYVK